MFRHMPELDPEHSFEERVARWKFYLLDTNRNEVIITMSCDLNTMLSQSYINIHMFNINLCDNITFMLEM